MSDQIEPVYTAKLAGMIKAHRYLAQFGIKSCHTKPTKDEGLLKVTRDDAARARELLIQFGGMGRVISESEAAFFFCHACCSPLSTGTRYCPQCGALVGDPHGM